MPFPAPTIESPPPAGPRPYSLVVSRGAVLRSAQIVALTALFTVALFPVSVRGMAVNYVFVLLPVVVALLHGRLRNPGSTFLLAICLYGFVFFAASIYQYEFATDSVRRFASFTIFMSIFSLAFMKIDEPKIAAFKTALVVMSCYLALFAAYTLLTLEAERAVLGFEAKNLVGTQRIGYIYIFALWLVYLDPQQRKFWGIARYPIMAVLGAGLLLTFSRSSVVALFASAAFFVISRHGDWLRRLDVRTVLNAILTLIGVVVLFALLYRMFPLAFRFFDARLLGFFGNGQEVILALIDPGTSEGTRIYIAIQILEFVVRNPLTGSGYLGPWVLRDILFGSAHNQYLDVLFRTGVAGLVVYLLMLVAIMRYLKRNQQALYWGMTGALVYGLFHETFKESQGAFIFAFLVGMTAQAWRDRRDARRRASAETTAPPGRLAAADYSP